MKKHNQRLGYQRLAEVLKERGLVDPQAIDETLALSSRGGPAFPDALVAANLIADWELSRLVCEVFGLPFLPVDIAPPDPDAMESLDRGFLIQTGLVPLGRFGGLLTVAMPALVPAETLGLLSARIDLLVLPVVGTVRSNRAWIEDHINLQGSSAPAAAEPAAAPTMEWSNLFDEADAAVLAELEQNGLDIQIAMEELEGLEGVGDSSDEDDEDDEDRNADAA